MAQRHNGRRRAKHAGQPLQRRPAVQVGHADNAKHDLPTHVQPHRQHVQPASRLPRAPCGDLQDWGTPVRSSCQRMPHPPTSHGTGGLPDDTGAGCARIGNKEMPITPIGPRRLVPGAWRESCSRLHHQAPNRCQVPGSRRHGHCMQREAQALPSTSGSTRQCSVHGGLRPLQQRVDWPTRNARTARPPAGPCLRPPTRQKAKTLENTALTCRSQPCREGSTACPCH